MTVSASALPQQVLTYAGPVPAKLPNLRARLGTPDDVPVLSYIINLAYRDSNWFKTPAIHNRTSQKQVAEYMTGRDLFIVLEDGDATVATVKLVAPTDEQACSVMSLLAVHPTFAKMGVAKYLFKVMCGMAVYMDGLEPGAGWSRLTCEVINLQPHLLSIYKSWGFVETGVTMQWHQMGYDSKLFTHECHLICMEQKLK
ncbi:hypothetical protein HDU99_010612 [Rhizoclosmatium hyalinum]|nr:hypothetical protein HDU99_010612 [Rhizoclosmatium hyalinum]